MFARQLQRFAADFAVEFAEGDERAGKGYRADEDADEDFNEMDGVHFRGDVAGGGVAADADEDCGEADEAVQERNQFGHLRHFDFVRLVDTEGGADEHGEDDVAQPGAVAVEGGDKGDGHADDAVEVAVFRAFLPRQSREREDEEDGGDDVGGGDESVIHGVSLLWLRGESVGGRRCPRSCSAFSLFGTY